MHIIRRILGTATFIGLAMVLAPLAWVGYLSRTAVIRLADRLLGVKFE